MCDDSRPLGEVAHRLPFSRAPLSDADERRADQLINQSFSPFDSLRAAHAQQPLGKAAAQLGSGARLGNQQWRVGIVILTRQPHCFEWWLNYHRNLGVCRFFIRVEGTPQLQERLSSAEYSDFVELLPDDENDEAAAAADDHAGEFSASFQREIEEKARARTEPQEQPLMMMPSGSDWWKAVCMGRRGEQMGNYDTLMARQQRTVLLGLKRAAAASINWLFHIDDDELLHFSIPFAEIVAPLPEGVSCLTLQNVEALPDAHESECVFDDVTNFCCAEALFTSYRNCKSAGRVGKADWQGPHRFSGAMYTVQQAFARVLHYESSTFGIWAAKFGRHALDTSEEALQSVPFRFYRDSIRLIQETSAGKEDDRTRQRAFYYERKLRLLQNHLAAGARYVRKGGGCNTRLCGEA